MSIKSNENEYRNVSLNLLLSLLSVSDENIDKFLIDNFINYNRIKSALYIYMKSNRRIDIIDKNMSKIKSIMYRSMDLDYTSFEFNPGLCNRKR